MGSVVLFVDTAPSPLISHYS